MRRNNKSIISSQEDTIQKSNELALANVTVQHNWQKVGKVGSCGI